MPSLTTAMFQDEDGSSGVQAIQLEKPRQDVQCVRKLPNWSIIPSIMSQNCGGFACNILQVGFYVNINGLAVTLNPNTESDII